MLFARDVNYKFEMFRVSTEYTNTRTKPRNNLQLSRTATQYWRARWILYKSKCYVIIIRLRIAQNYRMWRWTCGVTHPPVTIQPVKLFLFFANTLQWEWLINIRPSQSWIINNSKQQYYYYLLFWYSSWLIPRTWSVADTRARRVTTSDNRTHRMKFSASGSSVFNFRLS